MSRLLVSDVDDTLTGNDAALVQFDEAIAAARPSLIVAYNSSRPCASVRETIERHPHLPVPDYLIGALGTEIEDGRSGQRLSGYTALLNDNWHRGDIDSVALSLGCTPHSDEYQTPLKASYDIEGESIYLTFLEQLAARGLRAKVIFSNEIKLDVVPERAGKGSAIHYLVQHLGLQPEHVVVAGDSGNDIDMFTEPFRGVVVGNADNDLRNITGNHVYFAKAHHAAGVLEGLQHWGALRRAGV